MKKITLILALLYSLQFVKAQCPYQETFESFTTSQATSFVSNGDTFNIATLLVPTVSTGTCFFGLSTTSVQDVGWNSVTNSYTNDRKLIEDIGSRFATNTSGASVKISSTTPFSLRRFFLFVSNGNYTVKGTSGTISIVGKNGGTTVFNVSVTSSTWNSVLFGAPQNGYNTIDLATFGGQDNSFNTITEFTVTTSANSNMEYLAIDDFQHGPASPTAPTATTVAASGITTSTATLNGTVNANSLTTLSQGFQYSLSPTLASGVTTIAATPATASGISATNISANLSALSPSTTYYYRTIVTNCHGSKYGSILSFTTPSISFAPPGNTLHFDATNDFVQTTARGFALTNNFTIEAWVRPNHVTNTITFLSTREPQEFTFDTKFADGNKILVDCGNGSSWGSGNSGLRTFNYNYAVGKWVHIAITYNGTACTLYVNGVSLGTQTTTINNPMLFNTGSYIKIGSVQGVQYFSGNIDEVRFWSTTRTATEIQNNFRDTVTANSAGLFAYYRFDEGVAGSTNTSITSLPNLVGSSLTGTLNGFALTGSSSNWVESYAIAIPTATAATSITTTGFTANWTAPTRGTVDNGYRVEVSTFASFATQIAGSPFTVNSGTSQAITGLSSGTTYYYRVAADKTSVTGQGGYSATIVANTSMPVASTNADLSAMTISSGTLTPAFSSATIAYTASVTNATTNISVTPTKADANASIQVRVNSGSYATVASGSPSSALSLNVGANTLDVKVTAQDSTTIKTYTTTVTRAAAASNDCPYQETFESFTTSQATSFVSNGDTFNIATLLVPTVSTGTCFFGLSTTSVQDVGWNSVTNSYTNDRKLIEDIGSRFATNTSGASVKISSTTPFSLRRFFLFVSNGNYTVKGTSGTISIVGKNGGTTVFNVSVTSSTWNSVLFGAPQNGYNTIDLATFGGQDNSFNTITEFTVTTSANSNMEYLAIDDFQHGPASPTAPTATTVAASGITTSTATLNGTVNANSLTTLSQGFQYSLSPTLASGVTTIAATPATASGISATNISANLSALSPSTTYYYRTIVTNCHGSKYGSILNFTTSTPQVACFTKISAGNGHTLGIKGNGSLWAWGNNFSGQLGNGTTNSELSPIQVGTANNWTKISAGLYYTMAIKQDGTLWAWGNNGSGQLGDGTTALKTSPTQIGTATNWASVSAGSNHTLAIKTDGTLWAWGNNGNGRLGNGNSTPQTSPIQIGSENTWQSVETGDEYSVAIKTTGTLWAWGYNGSGQLGTGSNTSVNVPTQVGSVTTWRSLSAFGSHVVAVRTNGTLWAWGENNLGQLGDGTNTSKNSPTQIGVAVDWDMVSAGNTHSAATKTNGNLWAWGANFEGQIGNNTFNNSNVPVSITTGITTGITNVFAGTAHTLAINAVGILSTWGWNPDGQLGNGTTNSAIIPTSIACPGAVASTNADLSALSISSGTLSPAFAAATIAYTASVTNATTSINVTPTVADVNASIQVRVNSGSYANVASGSPSSALSLNVGANTIYIKVTAQDTTVSKTYSIVITRTNASAPSAMSYSPSIMVATRNNTIINATPTYSGDSIVNFSISPNLPTGVSLDVSTGKIIGVSSVILPQTQFTITGTNTGGSTTANFTLTVNDSITSIRNIDSKTFSNFYFKPNPFNSELELSYISESKGELKIIITDAMGREVLNKSMPIGMGENSISITEMNALQAGLYFAYLSSDNAFSKAIKLIKE
ncbi:MAG: cadherin-like beta sandwich domain-containing protein [Bacteroidia bacterium]